MSTHTIFELILIGFHRCTKTDLLQTSCKSYFTRYTFVKIWYLSAIEIIDTQVARRGRQYHRNPPPYKNRPTKQNRIYKIKNHPTTAAQPTQPTPHRPTQPNPTQHSQHPNPTPPPSPTQPNPT